MAQARQKRAASKAFRLNQDRDPEILLALAKMKFLRTRDLTRLFFGSKVTANKRLRQLFDAGLIQCWMRELYQDNLYSLAPKGRAYLVRTLGLSGTEFRVPASMGRVNLPHLLGINSFRISLALAVGNQEKVKIGFFLPDWELKHRHNAGLLSLVPDAVFVIEDWRQGFRQHAGFALEYDTGSESLAYWGKRKLQAYLEILGAGYPFYGLAGFRVVVIGSSARRVQHLVQAAREASGQEQFLFAPEEIVTEETILTPVFQTASALGAGQDPGLFGGSSLLG